MEASRWIMGTEEAKAWRPRAFDMEAEGPLILGMEEAGGRCVSLNSLCLSLSLPLLSPSPTFSFSPDKVKVALAPRRDR